MRAFPLVAMWLAASAASAVTLDTLVPGTNFTSLVVSGSAGAEANVTLAVTDSTTGSLVERVRPAVGEDGKFRRLFENLVCGHEYSVRATEVGSESADEKSVTMARKYEGTWIDENADTFAGKQTGTGEWRYSTTPSVEAQAVTDSRMGKAIRVTSELSSSVIFSSTNSATVAANATVRELSFRVLTESPGFWVSSPNYVPASSDDLAGVTIACDDCDGGEFHFAVYNPGSGWMVLHDTTAELSTPYEFSVVVTHPNSDGTVKGSLVYYLVKDGERQPIARISPCDGIPTVKDTYRSRARFVGNGLVGSVSGECHDGHLATFCGVEYWTVAEAIAAIGSSGGVLEPLWPSVCTPDALDGYFGVRDPEGLITFVWPLGYAAEITRSGDVNYYLFHLSDRWIDWAEASGVEESAKGWKVKTAGGLAWLARKSADEWLRGEISLAQDISNLYEHVWNPIRGFTGTFEGNGRLLAGLTNKGEELAETNELDLAAYGLFAAASNSVFRNVAFEGVSISNSADAVAALLGCSIGDLTLSNVVVRSGDIAGGGRYVAGLVGYVGDFRTVDIRTNFNAAAVTAFDSPLGGANASGIANLGTDSGVPGLVMVTDNENAGAIATTINNTPGGGNMAQILAGSAADARFDSAAALVVGNVGTGDVSQVTSLNHSAWPFAALPVVNLATEVSRESEEDGYCEFIEANDSTAMLIDPWLLTARMSYGRYQNGATNYAGQIRDRITILKPGDSLSLTESVEIWSPIVIDRAIILELDGYTIDGVFDDYLFNITCETGTVTIRKGTLSYPYGKKLTGSGSVSFVNVNDETWNEPYWEHKVTLEVSPKSAASKVVVQGTRADTEYCLQSVETLGDTWEKDSDEWVSVENDGDELVFPVDTSSSSGFYRIQTRSK